MKKAGNFMDTIKFYNELPSMEGLQGDTLPDFLIDTELEDLTGFSMELIIEDTKTAGSIKFRKSCEKIVHEETEIFSVQLTSEETENFCGSYRLYFWLYDGDGLKYKKLAGTLTFIPTPQEE